MDSGEKGNVATDVWVPPSHPPPTAAARSNDDDGYECTKSSNPTSPEYAGGSGGGGGGSGTLPASPPSRYLATSRIVGRVAGAGCEHHSPTFTAAATSAASYSPPRRGSTTFSTSPAAYRSHAHSASTSSSAGARGSMGCRPATTSSTSAPNANTSAADVAFPVRLGGQVPQRAHHARRARVGPALVELGEPEVAEPRRHVGVQEHVAGLDVAVEDDALPPLVQVQQRGRDVAEDAAAHGPRQPRRLGVVAEEVLVQAAVGHVVVDEEEVAAAAAPALELDQVAVAEAADGRDLRHELADALPGLVAHALHGHRVAGARQHAAVHLAEAAGAEELALAEPARGPAELRVLEPVRAVVQLPLLDDLAVLVPVGAVRAGAGEHHQRHERREGHGQDERGPVLAVLDRRQRRQRRKVEARRGAAAQPEAPAPDVVRARQEPRGRREADVHLLPEHPGQVDAEGDERLRGPPPRRRGGVGDGDIEQPRGAVVVDPGDGVPGLEVERVRRGAGVGDEAVEVDADVVAVDVPELEVLHGVELDGEDVVGGVAEVAGAEQAQVLAGQCAGEPRVGRHDEREAVPAQLRELGHHGHHELRGEGHSGAVGAAVEEAERGRVEGVADELGRLVGEAEEPVGPDLGDAVQGQVRVVPAEAFVGELLGGGEAGEEEEEEEEQEEDWMLGFGA
ncbi:LOW QUALITY PROTEIN: hypothetical protein U9M48_037156 [Paspalum notatum var. saurae]|uniref:Uncharacterized protein n=1 Tax=Paspalum notatum var. saurae TaxID=547442 RepID=A0AAQ3UJ28_PASNO